MLSRSSSWQIVRWNRIQARGCHNVLLYIEKTFALAILILHVCVPSTAERTGEYREWTGNDEPTCQSQLTQCQWACHGKHASNIPDHFVRSTNQTHSFIARREWSLTTWCEKPNSYASFSKSLREILLNLRMFSARFLAPLSRTSNVEMPRTSMKYRTHK